METEELGVGEILSPLKAPVRSIFLVTFRRDLTYKFVRLSAGLPARRFTDDVINEIDGLQDDDVEKSVLPSDSAVNEPNNHKISSVNKIPNQKCNNEKSKNDS